MGTEEARVESAVDRSHDIDHGLRRYGRVSEQSQQRCEKGLTRMSDGPLALGGQRRPNIRFVSPRCITFLLLAVC